MGILGRNALATNRNQQCIGNLKWPMCRDNGFITRPQAGQYRIACLGGFIGKAPGSVAEASIANAAISICALRESNL